MIAGQTLSGTIAALEFSLDQPDVDVYGGSRIGIKVHGFLGGGSETFVNGPGEPNGAPDGGATAALLGLAFLGLTRLPKKPV